MGEDGATDGETEVGDLPRSTELVSLSWPGQNRSPLLWGSNRSTLPGPQAQLLPRAGSLLIYCVL